MLSHVQPNPNPGPVSGLTSSRTLIIAEAGVNHNGDLALAKKLVDAAEAAGADFVKFQTYKTENLVSEKAEKADYQKLNSEHNETQFRMLKRLELSAEAHLELLNYCHGKTVRFLSTPFDLESVDLLEQLDVPVFKIPSGEITNLPLLNKIGSFGKPVFLSTGMATLAEVEAAVQALEMAGTPRAALCVLHCTTEYPAPVQEVNLLAMQTLKNELQVEVGYSDHTLGIEVSLAAVALGARVIEKHFTLDKTLPGPDHKASLEPAELAAMIRAIRNIELAFGNGEKKPSDSEIKNRAVARKSLHTRKEIQQGECFSETNLTAKRPGTGISPMRWNQVLGKIATRNLPSDHLLAETDFA